MIYLGIDPGKSGAIAAIDTALGNQSIKTIKLECTPADVIAWMPFLSPEIATANCVARIEKVSASPQMGVTSAFSFGRSYGWLLGVLDALRIRYEFVTPQKWQSFMGCRSGGNKNVTKAAAQRLWPEIKITHAIADALLIAEYCRRKNV